MMMRIRCEPLLLLTLVASLLGFSGAFLIPGPAASSSLAPLVGSSSQIGGRRAAAWPVLGPKKDDSDADLSAEFARRLEEDDEDAPAAPLPGRRRPPPTPQGVGTPQKAQRSFMTMPKTNSINRDLGTDYWMDEKDMKKEQAAKQVKQRKAAAPDQFPKERIRDEIVSPYKNNWILFIAITIFSLAFFVYLFPEELQIPSIQIPDFETGPAIPEDLE